MDKKIRPKILRYLLILALATTVVSSATLARYSTSMDGQGKALVAAFVTGESIRFDTTLEDLTPGNGKDLWFNVTNFQDNQGSDVALEYEIQVKTTGNLPLTFVLRGEKESEDADSGSVLAGDLDGELKATGGRLPPGSTVHRSHRYRLAITWPAEEADEDYSKEIDMVTLEVTTRQVSLES